MKYAHFPWLLCALLLLPGCAYYSFTGASVPAHLNTVAIPLVEDASTSPVPTLADNLTQLLTQRMVGQTRLRLNPDENEADAVLTARIDRYINEPAAVGAQEVATRNRVTLSVTVRYFDRVENKELLQRSFSGFAEYDPVQSGLEGETGAALMALRRIADDVFTAATSNW